MNFSSNFGLPILTLCFFACSCKTGPENCDGNIGRDFVFLPFFGVEQTYDTNRIGLQYREAGVNHNLVVETKTDSSCLTNEYVSVRIRFDDNQWKPLTDEGERKKIMAILRKASKSDYFDAYCLAWVFFVDKMREYYIYSCSYQRQESNQTNSSNAESLPDSEIAKIEYMDGFYKYITSIGWSDPEKTREIAIVILRQIAKQNCQQILKTNQ